VKSSFDQLINVNLKGPYFLSQAVARWMIDQKKTRAQDYSPAIINITSVSAFAASPERGDYCVSKAGLAMMTKLYALRLADEGINVYEIRPGVIETDMTAKVRDKIRSNDRGWVNADQKMGQLGRRRPRGRRDRFGQFAFFNG
jgi:NAD(P)-dependent dehydrogenase (short-subunit alcohol dehydrogenase family)